MAVRRSSPTRTPRRTVSTPKAVAGQNSTSLPAAPVRRFVPDDAVDISVHFAQQAPNAEQAWQGALALLNSATLLWDPAIILSWYALRSMVYARNGQFYLSVSFTVVPLPQRDMTPQMALAAELHAHYPHSGWSLV